MQTIAIDFDGVIHKYSKGWQDGKCYDEPVEGVFEAIAELMKTYTVFIFSTRSPRQIKEWLVQRIMESDYIHNGMGGDPGDYCYPKYGFTCERIPFYKKFWNKQNVLGITKRKLPAMVYVDDRAMRFNGIWGPAIMQGIKEFKTYQEWDKYYEKHPELRHPIPMALPGNK